MWETGGYGQSLPDPGHATGRPDGWSGLCEKPDHMSGEADQWNESPQAQEFVAFGLSMVKPCASIRSAKSIVAPARYGKLIRSTTTSTPEKSLTMSPSSERSSKKSW